MKFFPWGHKEKPQRRRHERIKILLRINYEDSSGTWRYNCTAKDISEGGMRFGLYQPLEIGMALKIQIYLHDPVQPVLAFGNVAWMNQTPGKEFPFEVGIKFDAICASAISKIKDHIRSIVIERKN